MKIVHGSDFRPDLLERYTDEPYFRLRHSLRDINTCIPDWTIVRTASAEDTALIARIINESYTDLSVTPDQVASFQQHPTYDARLWLLVQDCETAEIMGCGIGELDTEAEESILEWIQVLPQYRSQGVGQLIVNQLLLRMAENARFATVSGKVNNRTNPEKLYRKCGFTGSDVWHILTEK